MCCQNGIPYGSGPSASVIDKLVADKEFSASKIGKKEERGTTEMERAKEILDFFTGKGLAKEFGIAVAGVWSAESNIKTWIYNKSEHDNGFAFKNIHAPNAQKFTYNGNQYWKDQANMMKFGYGKGLAQWSWDRNLKFRDWYNGGADGNKTSDVSTMDENAANITATSVVTQTAFAWKEMQERTGEFMKTVNRIEPASPGTEDFKKNIIVCVDAVLRGYENGSNSSFRSVEGMNKYTWDGGYEGAMEKRVGKALGIYEELMKEGYI